MQLVDTDLEHLKEAAWLGAAGSLRSELLAAFVFCLVCWVFSGARDFGGGLGFWLIFLVCFGGFGFGLVFLGFV